MHQDYRFRALWIKGIGGPWRWLEPKQLDQELKRLEDTPDKFVSAQWMSSPVRKDDEPHWCDFFLDIDDKKATGKGREYAHRAITWGRKLGIPDDCMRLVSTGTGGMHVWMSGQAFGAQPSPLLTKTWGHVAAMMAGACKIPIDPKVDAHLDLSVYSKLRLMRVPGPRSDASECAELPLP